MSANESSAMVRRAERLGAIAYKRGLPLHANPYHRAFGPGLSWAEDVRRTRPWWDWCDGWYRAQREDIYNVPLDGTFEQYQAHFQKWHARADGDAQYVRAALGDRIGIEDWGRLSVREGAKVRRQKAWMKHRARAALRSLQEWLAFDEVYAECMEPTDEVAAI